MCTMSALLNNIEIYHLICITSIQIPKGNLLLSENLAIQVRNVKSAYIRQEQDHYV